MSKKQHKIIAFSIAGFLVLICILYSAFSSNFSDIDPSVTGNTAGNLNNKGLFCESDGEIFFSNTYDNYALYKMKSDLTGLTKLNDLSVKYINAGGKYVFFYGEPTNTTSGLGSIVAKPGMYQLTKSGKKLTALTKDVSQDMVLSGNTIYYQHYTVKNGTTFAKIDLKKKKSSELLDYMINPSCYVDCKIYFNGMYNDHYLYSYSTESGNVECIWEGDIWNPVYQDGYVYFMDVSNNYRLCRYSISENTIEILAKERIDYFNLYGNVIYYQTVSKEPCLKRVFSDGSNNEVIAEGVYSSVSVTSNYTFFTKFGDDYPIYYTPTFGSINVREFTEARDIIMKNE